MGARHAGEATMITRAVVLARRPDRVVRAEDFHIEERPLPALQEGEVLVRNAYMSVDPSMRGRLGSGQMHYTTNFEVGEPLDGAAIGRVVASEAADIPVGAAVRHRLGWRDLAVVPATEARIVDEARGDLPTWMGALGQTGFTAYVGLVRIAEIRPGDTVFVSGAAGAVGTIAAQMARLLGAGRVIGSAGGEAKCRLLTERFGLDAAFDYRTEPARVALPRLAPGGIDVYFDNVGGSQLAAALHASRIGGRIALCGQISQFDASDGGGDLSQLLQATLKRLTLRGFIVRDHEDLRPEFEDRVATWLRQGKLVSETTVEDGLDRAVGAFLGMLSGANVGKMLVRLDGDAGRQP